MISVIDPQIDEKIRNALKEADQKGSLSVVAAGVSMCINQTSSVKEDRAASEELEGG